MTQTLYILQGPAGSGKSTMAMALSWEIYNASLEAPEVCSTDNYFYENGFYNFNPKKLGENHMKCQEAAKNALQLGKTVIIDNTNIHAWEAKPYVAEAVRLGIPIQFIRLNGNFENTHGVPHEKVEQMRREIEELTVEKVMQSVAPWEKKNEV